MTNQSEIIYRAQVKWDSPVFRQTNRLNVSYPFAGNHEKLRFTCRKDYNKRGGALGNVECTIEGSIKEIRLPT
jgi:hypothetical protein